MIFSRATISAAADKTESASDGAELSAAAKAFLI